MARKRAKASAGNAANGGRRLVVVVAFDVVNFSALVEADEERVHAFKDSDKRRLFGEHLVPAGLPE